MSNEQQQERKPSAEAEAIRKKLQLGLEDAAKQLSDAKGPLDIAHAIGAILFMQATATAAVASELAEINSRDTAAEIRAREAEAFVLGMQQELQRLQGSGIVIPGFDFSTGKKGV